MASLNHDKNDLNIGESYLEGLLKSDMGEKSRLSLDKSGDRSDTSLLKDIQDEFEYDDKSIASETSEANIERIPLNYLSPKIKPQKAEEVMIEIKSGDFGEMEMIENSQENRASISRNFSKKNPQKRSKNYEGDGQSQVPVIPKLHFSNKMLQMTTNKDKKERQFYSTNQNFKKRTSPRKLNQPIKQPKTNRSAREPKQAIPQKSNKIIERNWFSNPRRKDNNP